MIDVVVYDLEEQGIKTIKASLIMFNWDDLTYEAYNRDGEIIYKGKVDNIGIIEEVKENFTYADGKTAEEVKEIIDCMRCKHYCGDGVIKEPCIGCTDYDCWEAKDNG